MSSNWDRVGVLSRTLKQLEEGRAFCHRFENTPMRVFVQTMEQGIEAEFIVDCPETMTVILKALRNYCEAKSDEAVKELAGIIGLGK